MKKVWLTFVLALVASAASAQSTGTVQVRIVDSAGRPLDGTVTFRSGNASASCRTVASRCSIALVPGTWSADVAPTRERSAGALQVAVTAGAVANVTFRTQPASAPTATVSPTTTTATTMVATPTPTTTTRTAPTVVRSVPNRATRDGRLRNPTPTPTVGNVAPVSTQPTVSPTVRSATATPIVRSATPTTTATTTTATTTTATTTATPTRDLGRGARVCAQGNVMDAAGRPADATLTVSRDGATLGTVRSVAGRFSMFDLRGATPSVP